MPFQAGQSGNPAGRVKRDFLTQHIIAELKELTADQVTKARKLIIALIDKAMDGDIPAIKEIFDRVEGKVPQVLAGDQDNPIKYERIERVLVNGAAHTNGAGIPTAH